MVINSTGTPPPTGLLRQRRRRGETQRTRQRPFDAPSPTRHPRYQAPPGGALAACSYISKGMGAQFLLATTQRCSGRLRWSMTARASLSTTTTAAGQRSPEAWRCLASWRSRRSGTSSPTETYRRPCCRQCASRTSRDLQPWQTVGQAQDEPTRAGRTRPPRRERTAPRLSYPTWSRPSDAPAKGEPCAHPPCPAYRCPRCRGQNAPYFTAYFQTRL